MLKRVLDALPPQDLEALREFERVHGLRILLQPGGLHTVAPLTAGPVDLQRLCGEEAATKVADIEAGG